MWGLRRLAPATARRAAAAATPTRRGAARRDASGPLLKYSTDFGTSSPGPGFAAHPATASYEEGHRLKGGAIGVADMVSGGAAVASCVVLAPGLVAAPGGAAPAELRGAGALSAVSAVRTERVSAAPDSVQLLSAAAAGGEEPAILYPSTRFKEGALVLAVGHQADGTVVVAPGTIEQEFDDDRQLRLSDCAALPLGGCVVDMTNPQRFFGVAAQDGSVVSTKDPYFVLNWVVHALPLLVPEQGRVNQMVMQYINDVKRTITRNKDAIPSMKLCNKIFVKNSLEDFKYNML